mmetsp:Transcript_15231/g.33595  ORF Transcript_15231/g.33595 Transcript_15231/m.33595 type:complete len:409 (-) Transcript_15231:240-1466(-)
MHDALSSYGAIPREGEQHARLRGVFGKVREKIKTKKAMGEADQLKVEYFTLGLFSGASFQLQLICMVILFLSSYQDVGPLNELSQEYFPVFRCLFYLLFFATTYGVGVFIWGRFDIPYQALLDLSPGHTYQSILRGAASLSGLVFTCFLLFILTITHLSTYPSKHLWPLLALLLPLLIFIWPGPQTSICFGSNPPDSHSHRWHLLGQVGAVLLSPWTEPTPLRVLIGDILCSMPKIFTDALYTARLYYYFGSPKLGHGPGYLCLTVLLSVLPYSLRLLQVARCYHTSPQSIHLWNALKYSLSITVTLLNTARTHSADPRTLSALWLGVASVTTLFSYYWDVVVGWGLGHSNSPNWGLRDELTFPPWVYYTCMVTNFLMRLGIKNPPSTLRMCFNLPPTHTHTHYPPPP